MNGPKEANEMLKPTSLFRRQQQTVILTIAAIASLTLGTLGALYQAYVLGDLFESSRGIRFVSDPLDTFYLALPFVVCLAEIVFGLGALRRESWAWRFGVVAQLLVCTYGLWWQPSWGARIQQFLLVLVSVPILIYLLTPGARQALRNGQHTPGADLNRAEAPPGTIGLSLGLAMAAASGLIIGALEVSLAVRVLVMVSGPYAMLALLPAAGLILAALAQLIFSIGALRRRGWARRAGIVAQVVQIAAAIVMIWLVDFSAGLWDWLVPFLTLMLAIVPAVMLIYLFTPAARHALTLMGPKRGAVKPPPIEMIR
jgi:hypothetical protein